MLLQVCVYFALTFAIPTTSRSLIIRTARRTTIIRMKEIRFMAAIRFRWIICVFGIPSRGKTKVVQIWNTDFADEADLHG